MMLEALRALKAANALAAHGKSLVAAIPWRSLISVSELQTTSLFKSWIQNLWMGMYSGSFLSKKNYGTP